MHLYNVLNHWNMYIAYRFKQLYFGNLTFTVIIKHRLFSLARSFTQMIMSVFIVKSPLAFILQTLVFCCHLSFKY